jgi:hypothetical protein
LSLPSGVFAALVAVQNKKIPAVRHVKSCVARTGLMSPIGSGNISRLHCVKPSPSDVIEGEGRGVSGERLDGFHAARSANTLAASGQGGSVRRRRSQCGEIRSFSILWVSRPGEAAATTDARDAHYRTIFQQKWGRRAASLFLAGGASSPIARKAPIDELIRRRDYRKLVELC